MELRGKEGLSIADVNTGRRRGLFVMSLVPSVSIGLILFITFKIQNIDLTVSEIFVIINLINGLVAPLRAFFLIIDKYQEYKLSSKSFNTYLFKVPNKPYSAVQDKELFKGYVKFDDCTVERYSMKRIKEMFDKIYSRRMVEAKPPTPVLKKSQSPNLKKKKKGPAIIKQEDQDIVLKKVKVFKHVNMVFMPRSKIGILGMDQPTVYHFIFTMFGETMIKKGGVFYNGSIVYSDMSDP